MTEPLTFDPKGKLIPFIGCQTKIQMWHLPRFIRANQDQRRSGRVFLAAIMMHITTKYLFLFSSTNV